MKGGKNETLPNMLSGSPYQGPDEKQTLRGVQRRRRLFACGTNRGVLMRKRTIGKPIKVNIDKSAVIAGVLALVLVMHILIGLRFAALNKTLGAYNEHMGVQMRINNQHLILIAKNQEVNWRQSMYLLPQLNCNDCHR